MKLTIEIERLSVSVNVANDKRTEETLRLYATYHGLVRENMNRRQVLRAALRQMLTDAQSVAVAQFEEERRAARWAEAVQNTALEFADEPEPDEPTEPELIELPTVQPKRRNQ
jgi:hypothetical protein